MKVMLFLTEEEAEELDQRGVGIPRIEQASYLQSLHLDVTAEDGEVHTISLNNLEVVVV